MVKLEYMRLDDVCLPAEEVFRNVSREVGDIAHGWGVRFEKKEQGSLRQLKAIDAEVSDVIAKPFRT